MESAAYTLVTGASSGIGRATAIRLSSDRRLILHGRDAQRLAETCQMCSEPKTHTIWPIDFNEPDKLAESLTPLLAEAGRKVEALVHCAGTVTVLPARANDHQTVLDTMSVNFLAAAEIVRLLLKKSINGAHGLTAIVFVSSILSRFGARGHSAYCASKAALDGFMRALAVELAPTVRVNSILPGALRTPMAEKAFADSQILAKLQLEYPLGIGEISDIADAVEYLLSGNSRWLTGQQIVIDGGRSVNLSLK